MSGIEWTEKTWNPVVGCAPVSSGCLNCYAAGMAVRLHGMTTKGRKVAGYGGEPLAVRRNGRAVFTGEVRCLGDKLAAPLRWRKPRKVFVNSMSDLFHGSVPFEFIDQVFAVMAATPRHTYQVLTKRPERMAEYLTQRTLSRAWTPSVRFGDGGSDAAKWKTPCDGVYTIVRKKYDDRAPLIWPLPNVWLGTSAEDQAAADERVPHLLRCPAAVRWLSMEPLLESVRLPIKPRHGGLDWIVVGGESGSNARPCDVRWVRGILNRAESVGVPVFVKQLGAHIIDRNDAGFEAENWVHAEGPRAGLPVEIGAWPTPVDVEHLPGGGYQGAPVRVRLVDSKGGDMSEWPMDLRVREMPARAIGGGA